LNGQSPLYALAALILAIGLAAGGWLIGQGFRESRTAERYVTVKGTSERTVKADLALWPIRFVATGNDLAQVQAKLVKDAATIRKLLSSAGLTEKDIELQRLDVTDLLAQAYRSGPVDSRFIVAQTLMARSRNVDQIAAAGQRLSELVDAGVVLSNEFGPGGPVYLFTKLNDIKPEMIAEATQNARAAAEQFAKRLRREYRRHPPRRIRGCSRSSRATAHRSSPRRHRSRRRCASSPRSTISSSIEPHTPTLRDRDIHCQTRARRSRRPPRLAA
jgi:hypothetical protein